MKIFFLERNKCHLKKHAARDVYCRRAIWRATAMRHLTTACLLLSKVGPVQCYRQTVLQLLLHTPTAAKSNSKACHSWVEPDVTEDTEPKKCPRPQEKAMGGKGAKISKGILSDHLLDLKAELPRYNLISRQWGRASRSFYR